MTANRHRPHSRNRRPPRSAACVGHDRSISVWPIVVGIALAAAMHFTLPTSVGPYYTKIVIDCRHRDHPGRVAQHRERHDGPVLARPRGVHGAGRLHGRA